MADYDAKGTRFQRENSDLLSALDAETGETDKAHQRISKLQSDLETALVGGETLMADYDVKVAPFQRDNSDFQSALDAKKGAANQTISNLQTDLQAARVGA